MRKLLLLPLLLLLQNCAKPKATVFKDERLSQEELLKFCFVGDLGRETSHQAEIAEALEREQCHRIFFLGDLVYPKGIDSVNDPELEARFLSYYRPLLDRDPSLEINLILGNHDHKKDPSAWKDVAKEYPGFFFPNYYYMLDYGGLCMVGLDTSFYYYTKKVAEAAQQSKWLLELQPRLKDCKVKVAFTHHPLKGGDYAGSEDWKGSDGPLRAFLESQVIGRFDMHVAGHVHVLADDGADEGTRMLISGTGGEVLGRGRGGFVVLSWDRNNPKRLGYNLRFVDTEVNVFDETQEEVAQESEYLVWIDRTRVEPGLFHRFLKLFFQ